MGSVSVTPDVGRSTSVIIPTLNEAGQIEETLRSAEAAFGPEAELVVVDGGSRDATRELASSRARVIPSTPGRGVQLNRGARHARGQILVFLHADTRVDSGSGTLVRNALAEPGVVGGCFSFRVNPPADRSLRWRLLEWGIALRTRLFRTATGDQTIFACREAFRQAGGYPEYPLFEDIAFVRRLRRMGEFRVLSAPSRTSRRRWEARGFCRTVLVHWLLRAAFRAGMPPERLAAWYHGRRPRRKCPLAPERGRPGKGSV